MAPTRVRLSRRRGWRMPANTVKVDRSTRWGNPFRLDSSSGGRAGIVEDHEAWITGKTANQELGPPPSMEEIRQALKGHNLACWCPLDEPCHADTLLRLANSD